MKNPILTEKMINFLINRFNIKTLDELNGIIEESIMKYYHISISDINKGVEEIEYKKEVNFENYVYIYMDPRYYNKEGWKLYEDKYCHFLPFYIGKGRGNRKTSHLIYSKNGNMERRLQDLLNENITPKIEIVSSGLTNLMAHNLENNIIYNLKEQNIILCNLIAGQELKKADLIISEINLEKQKNILILETLNSSKTINEASKKLGISERDLYRKIKNLNITKERLGTKKYLYKFKGD